MNKTLCAVDTKLRPLGRAGLRPVAFLKPKNCHRLNVVWECLGCGVKIELIKPGRCYAVEGEEALKKS